MDPIARSVLEYAESINYEPSTYPGINAPPSADPSIRNTANRSGVFVCLESSNKESYIFLDYWAGDMKKGRWKWKESITKVAKRHGLKRWDLELLVMNSNAGAYDLSRRCPSGHPLQLIDRGGMRPGTKGVCLCARCHWDRSCKIFLSQEEIDKQKATALVLDAVFGLLPGMVES